MLFVSWFVKLMWLVTIVSVTGLLTVLALALFADVKGSWYWKKRGW
jgi:UPF0716 family protein affecting phage T7 exclusion